MGGNKSKPISKSRIILLIVLIPIAVISIYSATIIGDTRGKIDFANNLDLVAATVDGEDILFEDLRFYILFEEQKVERLARIYNPDSPKDYWNSHTNGEFVDVTAKEAVLEMAIHDHIMYKMALEANTVLSQEEKQQLEESRTRFWDSLYEIQLQRLPLEYEEGNRIMKNIALVEAYAQDLAKESDTVTYSGLAVHGYDYENIKKEHDIKINKKVWNRVYLGEISLKHDKVNFINGLTDSSGKEDK